MDWLKIVAFSVVCAVLYGILHDMVTAHVAVEYFTIAHPPVFPTTQPFWLAIGWGIIATWWMGLGLGVILACSSRLGLRPKLDLVNLRPRIFALVGTMLVAALLSGLIGMSLQALGQNVIGYWSEEISPQRQVRFAFALWAHTASYLVGGLGGLILCGTVFRQRQRMR